MRICGKNVSIGLACVVFLLSAFFTGLPIGYSADVYWEAWSWGCPFGVYVVRHSTDGDSSGWQWNHVLYDLLFWTSYFSVVGFVVRVILRKTGVNIRPLYSLCIIGGLTGSLYAYLYRPDVLINIETGGYLTFFENRTEQFDNAMRFGDNEAAETLLRNHPDLAFSTNIVGDTPLHEAAYYGQSETVKLLLADKADVRIKNMYGETPLFGSAMNGHLNVTELLLKSGAEANIKNEEGETPFYRAAADGFNSTVKLLLANNADINARAQDGSTPLHKAAWNGYRGTVQLLIASNAEINIKNDEGETPLYLAAYNGHKDVVELLLANKADVNAKDKFGTTALQIASNCGYSNIVELLRSHGGTSN